MELVREASLDGSFRRLGSRSNERSPMPEADAELVKQNSMILFHEMRIFWIFSRKFATSEYEGGQKILDKPEGRREDDNA